MAALPFGLVNRCVFRVGKIRTGFGVRSGGDWGRRVPLKQSAVGRVDRIIDDGAIAYDDIGQPYDRGDNHQRDQRVSDESGDDEKCCSAQRDQIGVGFEAILLDRNSGDRHAPHRKKADDPADVSRKRAAINRQHQKRNQRPDH